MVAYVLTTLIVEGHAEKLDKFIQAVAGDRGKALSFQKIAPVEKRGTGDLLMQLKKSWGTTTDAQDVECSRASSDKVVMFFETALAFPHAIIERLVDRFDGLKFRGHFSLETGGLIGAFNGKRVETATDIDLRQGAEGKPLLHSMPVIQSYMSLVAELGRSGRTLASHGFDRMGGIKAEVTGPGGFEARLMLGSDGRAARINNGHWKDINSLITQEGLRPAGPAQRTPRRQAQLSKGLNR